MVSDQTSLGLAYGQNVCNLYYYLGDIGDKFFVMDEGEVTVNLPNLS